MEVVILPDAEAIGALAARLVAAELRRAERPVLGLATGSSPLGIYAALRRLVDAGDLALAGVPGFALDEYVGLPTGHPESYAEVLRREVVEPLRMDPALVRAPDGAAADLEAACAAYERAIAEAGGITVQILGIGENGHIGFNEPTSSLASRTRIKTLAAATRAANARFFPDGEAVPTHCLTQGLGTILEAGALVLVAQGERKAEAVRQAVEGPLSSRWPASALQLHRRATVIVDEAAASRLELADYYRETFAAKPDWQRV